MPANCWVIVVVGKANYWGNRYRPRHIPDHSCFAVYCDVDTRDILALVYACDFTNTGQGLARLHGSAVINKLYSYKRPKQNSRCNNSL